MNNIALGGCGTGIDGSDGLGGYRFRKAIAAINRGEYPVSQGIEQTVQGMVKISYEHFPEETQKVLNGLSASGEAVDAVVDFADRTTGRVVSKKWNSLDQATRDELAGYGKILSVVVPATKVRALTSVGGVVTKTADTASDTSRQALRKAKEANGIPKSAQPDRTIKPNTPEGNQLGLDNRNIKLYEYTNSQGQKIHIRQDKAASYGQGGVGDQKPHFNAGEAGAPKLRQHHYYDEG